MTVRKRKRRRAKQPVGLAPQRKVVRVLTEGEVTEPGYLDAMAGWNVVLDLGDRGLVPLTLVQRAREQAKRNVGRRRDDRFDEIWCVFDRDEHLHIPQAFQEARDSGIHVAFSNPCVELWLVLHEEDQTAHITRDEIQKRCRELGLVDGKRIPAEAVRRLELGYAAARQRAMSLDRMHESTGSGVRANPSSDVWRLVDRLRQ